MSNDIPADDQSSVNIVIDLSIVYEFLKSFGEGKESAGILKHFQWSEILRNVKYVNYLGDADSKAFKTVSEAKVYGNDFEVKKNWNAQVAFKNEWE
ncbi:hypothetical protein TNCT_630801 [Trichonephila clavata]|uniref:Uncharacterized protein n=1 Tax=Trichonephila clavata TaxID=2740835 RepID=A0A8X6FVB8_TRICU|nr:hypothetical protein TNCT_630801 [Trichonephila clavata]